MTEYDIDGIIANIALGEELTPDELDIIIEALEYYKDKHIAANQESI